VNPEGSFFDFAVTNTALLHALLSLVAVHYTLSYPQQASSSNSLHSPGYQIVHHQAEAVKYLNWRLGVGMEMHWDDALVIAVALLSNCEVSSVSFPAKQNLKI
jgi:hypothetical protein